MRYEVKGEPFGVLVCQLENGEEMKCQSGAMAWMTPSIQMATKVGGFGKLLKRAITNESIALNHYSAAGSGEIAFAMHFPGRIIPVDVSQSNIIAQKSAFLACESGVDVDIAINERIGTGFFGGEGFIMERFSGSGYAFIEVDGDCEEKVLAPGETLIVDSGYVAAMEASVGMRIERIKGAANIMLGGEGLFNTVLTGPGKVWLQTMPLSTLCGIIASHLPAKD